jgi:hypothetical protein
MGAKSSIIEQLGGNILLETGAIGDYYEYLSGTMYAVNKLYIGSGDYSSLLSTSEDTVTINMNNGKASAVISFNSYTVADGALTDAEPVHIGYSTDSDVLIQPNFIGMGLPGATFYQLINLFQQIPGFGEYLKWNSDTN